MKKRFIICIIIVLILTMCFMTACNTQLVDVTWNFNRAIIKLPNGEIIEGKVDSWKNFEDGDQVQVKIEGVTYLTFSANVVLISD